MSGVQGVKQNLMSGFYADTGVMLPIAPRRGPMASKPHPNSSYPSRYESMKQKKSVVNGVLHVMKQN